MSPSHAGAAWFVAKAVFTTEKVRDPWGATEFVRLAPAQAQTRVSINESVTFALSSRASRIPWRSVDLRISVVKYRATKPRLPPASPRQCW